MASTRRSASQDVGRNVPTSNPSLSSPPTIEQAMMMQTQLMEEKKRKRDLQCQLRNTHPQFAMQPEYQSHPMNLLVNTDQNQLQPDDEVQQVSSQEPCLSSPTITYMKTNTPISKKCYDCDENNYLEKFVENNQGQNQPQQEPEQNVHRKQVHGNN